MGLCQLRSISRHCKYSLPSLWIRLCDSAHKTTETFQSTTAKKGQPGPRPRKRSRVVRMANAGHTLSTRPWIGNMHCFHYHSHPCISKDHPGSTRPATEGLSRWPGSSWAQSHQDGGGGGSLLANTVSATTTMHKCSLLRGHKTQEPGQGKRPMSTCPCPTARQGRRPGIYTLPSQQVPQ